MTPSPQRKAFACGELFVPIIVAAVLAAVLVPNFIKARRQGQLTACKSNLKYIATAIEMYSQDSHDMWPEHLDPLVPKYLKALPTCPAHPSQAYASAYEHVPGRYTLTCQGSEHGLLYSAETGLQEIPLKPGTEPFSGGRFFLLLFVWYLFAIKLFARPDPMRTVQDLEAKYVSMAGLGCFGWLTLNGLLAYLGYLRFGAAAGPILGAVSADLLVRTGWWAWEKMSPSPEEAQAAGSGPGPQPGLAAPLRASVQWSPPEKKRYLLISWTPPLGALILFTLPIWLADPWQSRFTGLAAAALVSLPLYLWGRRLGQLFLYRELELLPGAGIVLECRRRWGRPESLRVGSLAEAVRQGNELRLGDRTYLIQDDEFLRYFQ